jgi:hypothetical protein
VKPVYPPTTSLRGGIKIYKIKYSKEVDATVSGKKLEVQKNPNNPEKQVFFCRIVLTCCK